MDLSLLATFYEFGYWVATCLIYGTLIGFSQSDWAAARPSFASTLPLTLPLSLLHLAVWLASAMHFTLYLLCIYLVFDLAFREKAPFWPFQADLPGFR